MPLLSEPEIAAFKRDGFLVKHGLLDAQLMAQCRARLFRGFVSRRGASLDTSHNGPTL